MLVPDDPGLLLSSKAAGILLATLGGRPQGAVLRQVIGAGGRRRRTHAKGEPRDGMSLDSETQHSQSTAQRAGTKRQLL